MKDLTTKYYKPITEFSPVVNKTINDLDRKFYLLYLILCAMVAPFFSYYLQAQDWIDHVITNFIP